MPADSTDPRTTDRLVLTPSRVAQGFALLVWLAVAFSGKLWWSHGGAVATAAASVLAAMTALFMLPNYAKLVLTRDGLEHYHGFRVRFYAWPDIHALRLGTRLLGEGPGNQRVPLDRVVFNLSPVTEPETDRHDVILDSQYGLLSGTLLELLRRWQAHHDKQI